MIGLPACQAGASPPSPDKVQAPAGVGVVQGGPNKVLEKLHLKHGGLLGGSREGGSRLEHGSLAASALQPQSANGAMTHRCIRVPGSQRKHYLWGYASEHPRVLLATPASPPPTPAHHDLHHGDPAQHSGLVAQQVQVPGGAVRGGAQAGLAQEQPVGREHLERPACTEGKAWSDTPRSRGACAAAWPPLPHLCRLPATNSRLHQSWVPSVANTVRATVHQTRLASRHPALLHPPPRLLMEQVSSTRSSSATMTARLPATRERHTGSRVACHSRCHLGPAMCSTAAQAAQAGAGSAEP